MGVDLTIFIRYKLKQKIYNNTKENANIYNIRKSAKYDIDKSEN